MSLFANLTTDGLEESQDRLGGFTPLDTDIYPVTIKLAYAGASDGGARFVAIVADIGGGKEYRETIYITNKKGENFFMNPNDKSKKVPLPGFTTIDDICLIADGKPLAETSTEDKVVNLYNYDAKKELPTKVPVLVDLLGKTVALGILRKIENKQAKNSAGVYEPTEETRESNVIEKVFHPELKMTVAEGRATNPEAKFWDSWLDRNKGVTKDARKLGGSTPGRPTKPGAPPVAGQAAPVRTSLFGKK